MTLADWDRFHRGDRVRRLADDQHGIVDGWKGDQVLVYWGTMNTQDYRSWEPRFGLELEAPQIFSPGV